MAGSWAFLTMLFKFRVQLFVPNNKHSLGIGSTTYFLWCWARHVGYVYTAHTSVVQTHPGQVMQNKKQYIWFVWLYNWARNPYHSAELINLPSLLELAQSFFWKPCLILASRPDTDAMGLNQNHIMAVFILFLFGELLVFQWKPHI